MGKKRILIGSPIQQFPIILEEFLLSLTELTTKNELVHYMFIDDNKDPLSSTLLADFENENKRTVILKNTDDDTYVRHEMTHYWTERNIWKVAQMKDTIISYALKEGFDYLFLIDSDLVLHPHTLQQLLQANKDIISNIYWTRWQPDSIELPQVWLMDQYTLTREGASESVENQNFLEMLRKPGVYEVGGLGACTLIHRKVLEAGVNFKRIANLSFWGEDRHFCVRAVAMGFSLHVDTHLPGYHIYRQSDLAGVSAYRKKNGMTAGKANQISISLCMIVKNEEDALERCLSTVADLVDEIIIVDTGSTDGTKEIASNYGCTIYDFEWIDDFSAARNYAFSKATCPYILWLDADDILLEKDRQLFLELKFTLNYSIDSVTMNYNLSVDSNGNVAYSIRRNRLVKRDRGFRWIGPVHEYLEVSGNIINSDISITHNKQKEYTDRNLQIYRRRDAKGEEFSPRDLYYYANELRDNQYYEEAITFYTKFLNTQQGWVEDNINACLKLASCYSHLYERQNVLSSLYRTFNYDRPRAEACCQIGAIHVEDKNWLLAIFWYDLATKVERPAEKLAHIDHVAWTWLPHLQLCLCYSQIGDNEKSRHHNDIAYSYNPTHPSILYNKRYFESLT
ncbi:glycosyltransferase [Brevibacillus sp. MER 51]|uniref:glycosyltransferase n=1 Tax=Brevibacillus sp. MER 51 TaxID=2939560 RepID=UPI00203ACA79|nr:glycosyltransferase [Brevibacillus sp. MER 51]MCM3143995.1 glycosyltransferase [Brevibacillus sp. MER 51]